MTTEVELLPCPFCGGAPGAVRTTDVDDTKWVHVECYGCGARTRGDWTPPSSDQHPIFFQEVRAEWNRRANVAHATAPLQAEIEALRAEVERWKGQHMRDSAELRRLCQRRDEHKDRADKLAEALRLIESAKDRGFGIDYARGVAQSALLRDQDGGLSDD